MVSCDWAAQHIHECIMGWPCCCCAARNLGLHATRLSAKGYARAILILVIFANANSAMHSIYCGKSRCSPTDWCANRAALRSETVATIVFGHFARNIRSPSALPQRKVAIESVAALSALDQS